MNIDSRESFIVVDNNNYIQIDSLESRQVHTQDKTKRRQDKTRHAKTKTRHQKTTQDNTRQTGKKEPVLASRREGKNDGKISFTRYWVQETNNVGTKNRRVYKSIQCDSRNIETQKCHFHTTCSGAVTHIFAKKDTRTSSTFSPLQDKTRQDKQQDKTKDHARG